MKMLERAVALVSLGHEILTAPIPVGIARENRDLRSHIMGRMQSTFAQNMRGHSRRGRLSVHSGNDDAAFPAHDGGERFSATRHIFLRCARARKNRVVEPYGRGKND